VTVSRYRIPVQDVIVSSEDKTVHLELVMSDAYAAAVLREDIVDRLKSGEKLRINLQGPPQEPEIIGGSGNA